MTQIPVTEDVEYVDSIKEDIRWLGFTWSNEYYSSDYFDEIYLFAVRLIEKGLAYVDDSRSIKLLLIKEHPQNREKRMNSATGALKKTFVFLRK